MFKKSPNVITGVYVIRDDVAGVYGIPIILESDGLARRQFIDYLAQDSVYGHRSEFSLHHIADYCSASATYYPLKEKDRIILSYSDVKDAVDRLRSEAGAAVGVQPPQAASSDL